MKYKVLFSTQKGVITIKVKVIGNFYDSTAGNILRGAGDILEVTEERFKVLDEYKLVEKIENKQSKDA